MQALLALLAACSWGSGNFTMGWAGRRSNPRVTVLVGFGAGLVGSLIFFVFQQPHLSGASFTWGALAGLAQGLGWLSFSRALMLGRISLVAPLASATTTAALYLIGVISGNPVGLLSVSGALCAITAIVLLSRAPASKSSDETKPVAHERAGVAYALIAGAMFTLQSLALNEAGTKSSSVVVIGAALGVVVLLLLTLLSHPLNKGDFGSRTWAAGLGGFVIFVGDVSYLYALSRGPLSTAGVLGNIHPVFTVLLAQIFLRERISRGQLTGVALAIAGASLIAAS